VNAIEKIEVERKKEELEGGGGDGETQLSQEMVASKQEGN